MFDAHVKAYNMYLYYLGYYPAMRIVWCFKEEVMKMYPIKAGDFFDVH